MDRETAKAYISKLTHDEKIQLSEMLKDLEQTRQPFPAPAASVDKGAQ